MLPVMCGRFTQTKSREQVLEELGGIELPPLFQGRYNVAPTQRVVVIQQQHPEKATEAIWGFISPFSGGPVINARYESLTDRPMFRKLIGQSRCLIPADGFYEWKDRQPYYFQLPSQNLFAFAGLWHQNRCVIITRSADENMRGLHDRMPVIFTLERWADWLKKDRIPEHPPSLAARPVSRRVNSATHDGPECLLPGTEQIELDL